MEKSGVVECVCGCEVWLCDSDNSMFCYECGTKYIWKQQKSLIESK